MNRVYLSVTRAVHNRSGQDFGICFISTRLARLILKKTLVGQWDTLQMLAVPVKNAFNLTGYVPAVVSPTKQTVFFIKISPGLYKDALRLIRPLG